MMTKEVSAGHRIKRGFFFFLFCKSLKHPLRTKKEKLNKVDYRKKIIDRKNSININYHQSKETLFLGFSL